MRRGEIKKAPTLKEIEANIFNYLDAFLASI